MITNLGVSASEYLEESISNKKKVFQFYAQYGHARKNLMAYHVTLPHNYYFGKNLIYNTGGGRAYPVKRKIKEKNIQSITFVCNPNPPVRILFYYFGPDENEFEVLQKKNPCIEPSPRLKIGEERIGKYKNHKTEYIYNKIRTHLATD